MEHSYYADENTNRSILARVSPPAVIAASNQAILCGRYEDAVKLITDPYGLDGIAPEWQPWFRLIESKAHYHLGHFAIATELVTTLLAAGKLKTSVTGDFAAELYTLYGLLYRQRAWSCWKEERLQSAKFLAWEAIKAFRFAQGCVNSPYSTQQKYNGRLNEIYAFGLLAAIAGKSKAYNPQWIIQAIKTEKKIRDWSPLKLANPMVGLTITADLARGAGLAVSEIWQLDQTSETQAACLAILGGKDAPSTWPELLVKNCELDFDHPHSKAKGLVLATAIALRDQKSLSGELASSIRFRLVECEIALRRQHVAGEALHPIMAAIDQLTAVLGTAPPSLRMFR